MKIAISVGCPCGIGPEVTVASLGGFVHSANVLLVGDFGVISEAARLRGVPTERFVRVASAAEAWGLRGGRVGVLQPTAPLARADRRPGEPTPRSGGAQLAWIDAACDVVAAGEADALVTGPVSKEVIASSGVRGASRFLGHTEHLQERLGAREVVMSFFSPRLTTALVTTHLPLADVPRAITPRAVASATFWLAATLAKLAGDGGRGGGGRGGADARGGARAPVVAVASLNPHAGEGGLLGRAESTRILPGIVRARARLARAGIAAEIVGPVPAETALRVACGAPGKRRYDAVVAMYHDQATIPMKLASFGDAVNVSLGLPIVRTSVDHGTAYDVAGRGVADPRGMRAAIALARRLARR